MQLISLILFIGALASLIGAIFFVEQWHNTSHRSHVVQMLREGIDLIGISAIVEYPSTPAPLIALLEEEYPRSEAVIVTDLQPLSQFGEIIRQFCLIKVNHNPQSHIRALYRSRHRAYRRVVLIDLPEEYRNEALEVAREVVSYNYILRLEGECQVSRETLTYCANIIASYPITQAISLKTVVGAKASLELADSTQGAETLNIATHRILAWHETTPLLLLFAVILPALLIVMANLSGDRLLIVTAIIVCLALLVLLYLSWRVVTEKGLFATTNTIIINFYRYIVEHIKKIYYLYKGSGYRHKGALLSLRYLIRRRE